jgi:DNA topoisomerase-3
LSKILVIAEKPSVAADIAKVVGAKDKGSHAWEGERHIVSWAVGHLLEFQPPEHYGEQYKKWRMKDLPILPAAFQITPTKGASKQLKALEKFLKAKDVERVVNACDAGREGELIFREIYRYSGSSKPVERLWLQSMTPDAIRESLKNPRPASDVDGLADAADCRAESDWLIGMNATRALTVRLRSSRDKVVWSAGRVQTATLAMLVRREREILAHEPQPFWTIDARFSVGDGGNASARAHDYSGTWADPEAEPPRDRIFDSTRRDAVLAALARRPSGSATETRKDSRELAPPLFDLTSLQREANRRFGFSARRTLDAAQALYETHKLITYPRTDSRALPQDYRPVVHRVLEVLSHKDPWADHSKRLLADGLQNTHRNFDDKAVSDHFAIIPTGQGSGGHLRAEEAKVYDLVVRRFLAAFHPPAISTEVERTTSLHDAEAAATGLPLEFRTRRKVLKVPGWRAVWDKEGGDSEAALPPLPRPEGTPAALLDWATEEKETRPPARITEAALLGLMESAGREVDDSAKAQILKESGGIGTPATRADIIETLLDRQYASRCTGLDNKKSLRATARGVRLVDALERIDLPRLTSAEMTADLEDALRDIEHGRKRRSAYMSDIRKWTETIVDRVRGFQFDTLFANEPPLGPCPLCGAEVVESLRAFACRKNGDGGTCAFILWKEVGGRIIDRKSAEQLVLRGETPPKAGFFTRDEREYEARLRRGEDGRVEVVSRSLEGAEAAAAATLEGAASIVEPLDIGPCPFHQDWMVRRGPQGYRCDGFARKQCKLSVPISLCQRPMSPEEVAALIGAERKTSLLEGFISKRSRPFSAILNLEANGRLRWEFPPRERGAGKGAGRAAAREFPSNGTVVGKCPTHKDKDVVETTTAFACTESGCKVAVPREICKRELKVEEARTLFAQKETPLLEGFLSKAGKPFAAQLYLKRGGKHGFRFAERD